MPSMIAIVHSTYSQSVHAPASHAGLMDNEAERYCISVRILWEALSEQACITYLENVFI